MTADRAAETLVTFAKEHFPESDLANSTWTAPGTSVALGGKNRHVDPAPLRQFVSRLKYYCKIRLSLKDLKLLLHHKVFRKRVMEEQLPSCLQTLMEVVNWFVGLEHRLMVFFAHFSN